MTINDLPAIMGTVLIVVGQAFTHGSVPRPDHSGRVAAKGEELKNKT